MIRKISSSVTIVLLLMSLISMAPVAIQASGGTTSFWTGDGDGTTWSDPLNWDTGSVPGFDHDIVLPDSAGTIHLDQDTTLEGSLKIGQDTTLQVQTGIILTLDAHTAGRGSVINHGTIDGTAWFGVVGGTFQHVAPALHNHADAQVTGIRFRNSEITNHGTLEGVTIHLLSSSFGALILENNGTITDAEIQVTVAFGDAPVLSNNPTGTITGGTLAIGGPRFSGDNSRFGHLDNQGTITGAALEVHDLVENHGTIDLTGGSLTLHCIEQPLRIPHLTGNGTITGGDPIRQCAVWDGGGDGTTWSDPENWNLDRLPAPDGFWIDRFTLLHSEEGATLIHLDADLVVPQFHNIRIVGASTDTVTFIVDPGVTLTLEAGISTSGGIILTHATLRNEGTLINERRILIGLSGGIPGALENEGTLTNTGGIHTSAPSTFSSTRPGGTLDNSGTLENKGTIDNKGIFRNLCGGEFLHTGELTGNAVVEVACDPPPAPIGFTAAPGPGVGEITLSWDPPETDGNSPLTGYRLYHGTESGGPYEPIAIPDTATLTFTHSGLGNGEPTYYVVTAENEVGEGPFSPEVSAVTFDVPTPPQELEAVPGPGVGEISLSWAAPHGDGGLPIIEYKVYAGGSSDDLRLVTTVTQRSFQEVGLGNAIIRHYHVTAVNDVGEGALSGGANATTFDVPTSPLAIHAEHDPFDGEVVLTWEPPVDDGGLPITRYNIYTGAEGSDRHLLSTVTGTDFVESGLPDDVDRSYVVAAVNDVGEGPTGDPVTVILTRLVGVDVNPGGGQGNANGNGGGGGNGGHINSGSDGLVQVAVLSAQGLMAPSHVDRDSLTFGATGDEDSHSHCHPKGRDVDGDGRKDMVCFFRVRDTGLSPGDQETVLKGRLFSGHAILGVAPVDVR